jgi:4-hydroxy 2-oxovalerate aldolase
MINQSEFPNLKDITRIFEPDQDSGFLDFVRIATNIDNLDSALDSAAQLTQMGFQAFVNLMQASSLSLDQLATFSGKASGLGLAGVYLADSFGALKPRELEEMVNFLVSVGEEPVGVHCHDNLGLALANSLAAIDAGATFIDGTVLGVGRGAGNTNLEDLVLQYRPEMLFSQSFSGLLELWTKYAAESEDITRWGKSPEYGLAAKRSVHPTYVQDLVSSKEYSLPERLSIIEDLGRGGAKKFENTRSAIGEEWFEAPGKTGASVRKVFENKRVMLVGTGPSSETYQSDWIQYASEQSLVVCLVGAHAGKPEFGDYMVVCNPITFIAGGDFLLAGLPIIGPLSQTKLEASENTSSLRNISVNVALDKSFFGVRDDTVHIPNSRSSVLALAMAAGFGASDVVLAGFDGYPLGDPRNKEFQDSIDSAMASGLLIRSVGPCAFNVGFVTL